MGLYLCIFDDGQEIDGVEVGAYADFNALRDYIINELEDGKAGSRFKTFILHSDCDGEWSPQECEQLSRELMEIITELKKRQPVAFLSDWQKILAKSIGLHPKNAFESFIDVDGEFLLDRILKLVDNAINGRLSIIFQ